MAIPFTYPCPRKLREIMKMSLIERELPGAIKGIWTEYHSKRTQNVATAISASQYFTYLKRAKESPLFLFPLFRQSGYFFMLSQSQEKSNLFTYLEDFKKSPTTARPYFVLTFFDEIVASKGIALVRGDIIDQHVTRKEAENIIAGFLAHYIETGLYEDNVHVFNHNPTKFNHEAHVQNYFNRFPSKN